MKTSSCIPVLPGLNHTHAGFGGSGGYLDTRRTVELTTMASGGGRSRRLSVTLPERREHMNAVIRAERTATKITHVAPLLIPGILQTYDVMRAIMVAGGVDESEIDERVNDRLGRRHLITR